MRRSTLNHPAQSANEKAGNGARSIIARMRKVWGESPFYQAQLKGPAPDRLFYKPDDPRNPDQALAQSLAQGRIALGEDCVDCEGELDELWDLIRPDTQLYAYMHEFSWLSHLSALENKGEDPARILMKAWLDRYERWSSETWTPYFVAERLAALCAHHPLLLSGADALWRSRVLTSMARQTRHLARTAHCAETGYERLMTALGLGLAGYCLPGCEGPAERGLEMVRREVRLQFRPDGGHVSRNPSRQLKLAFRLQSLADAIEARGLQAPGFLRHIVARASAMAIFFRCADGRLAVFNGGYEDDGRMVLAVQKAMDAEAAPADFARHSGYHRIAAARSLLIADSIGEAGARPSFQSGGSLHFSSGRSRIFVNCGNGGHRSEEWRKALERRAAHSALSFEPPLSVTFGEIGHRRAEEAQGQLLELERQLMTARTDGAQYVRRLFLSASGADLRGEEILTSAPADFLRGAVWRFHLHPSVRASLARDRRSIILLLPNKEGWRFKSNCPEIRLDKSIYCGGGAAPLSTEQIVIEGARYATVENGELTARWALQRLDAV